MKQFAKNIDNEILYLKNVDGGGISQTPYLSFDDIFSRKNNFPVKEVLDQMWKVGSSIFYKNRISSPICSSIVLKNHIKLNLTNKRSFGASDKLSAIEYSKQLLKNGKVSISPNDLNSIHARIELSSEEEVQDALDELGFLKKYYSRTIQQG